MRLLIAAALPTSSSCTHWRDSGSCIPPVSPLPCHNQSHFGFGISDQVTADILLLAYKLRDENTCMKHTVFVDIDNQKETWLIISHSIFALVSLGGSA